ncbi:membrane-associated PAP2 superfamily phosphatase [Acinetobacter calcoaceticus]|uniref:Membrane-associated PAP2 superfamily phosphatase n=1 Tax=Acinetobacter calcoaceticus TaxID=471 RepID=A0A4R1XMD2_ACICA|nr:membrane-associated PAP2 superfamily phosphatase [Acinetobacter calcoaceticus]
MISATQKKYLSTDFIILFISLILLLLLFPIGGKIDLYLIQPWMDSSGQFIYRNHWLLTDINHQLFKKLLFAVYISFLVLWILSFKIERFKPNRAIYGYMFWVSALSTGLVGLLKSQSRHDCPWNMVEPTATAWVWDFSATQGHCSPGGHASAGFALMTGYFVYRLSNRKRAYLFLIAGLVIGSVLGWGQMMRGAHFLSHNLWTAWYVFALNSVLFAVFYRKLNLGAK